MLSNCSLDQSNTRLAIVLTPAQIFLPLPRQLSNLDLLGPRSEFDQHVKRTGMSVRLGHENQLALQTSPIRSQEREPDCIPMIKKVGKSEK